MTTLLTGATGLTGTLLLERLARDTPQTKVTCLVRSTSNCTTLNQLNLKIDYLIGDSSNLEFWQKTFEQTQFDAIMHLVQLRHVPLILN
ncbi:MAG: NAD-dependent epimerase/dehydratase family protein, partial [Cyanobacteria bacterium J083]